MFVHVLGIYSNYVVWTVLKSVPYYTDATAGCGPGKNCANESSGSGADTDGYRRAFLFAPARPSLRAPPRLLRAPLELELFESLLPDRDIGLLVPPNEQVSLSHYGSIPPPDLEDEDELDLELLSLAMVLGRSIRIVALLGNIKLRCL